MTDAIIGITRHWESDIHSLFLVGGGARLVHGVAPRVLQGHAPRVQVVSRELKCISWAKCVVRNTTLIVEKPHLVAPVHFQLDTTRSAQVVFPSRNCFFDCFSQGGKKGRIYERKEDENNTGAISANGLRSWCFASLLALSCSLAFSRERVRVSRT